MSKEEHLFLEKYCVNLLLLRNSGNGVERIGTALFNSKIRMTPHQVQAALFAFNSPLSKGVLLADEVGLGKTIEAGIIISQLWNEGKKKILIVTPASLMRQWNSELFEKFNLNSFIMDRKMFNKMKKQGYTNPFKKKDTIFICSYQMCSSFMEEIKLAGMDFAIIDEAHKLRNVHNKKNITSNNIKLALENYKKVLLTATPIQNSLMDIYGLASIIDMYILVSFVID